MSVCACALNRNISNIDVMCCPIVLADINEILQYDILMTAI